MITMLAAGRPTGRRHLRLASHPHTRQATLEEIGRLRDELGEASDDMLWLSPVRGYSPDHLVRVLFGFRWSLHAAVGAWAGDAAALAAAPRRPLCARLRSLQRVWVDADRALARAAHAAFWGAETAGHVAAALLAIQEMDRLAKGLIRTAQLRSAAPLHLPRPPRRRRVEGMAA